MFTSSIHGGGSSIFFSSPFLRHHVLISSWSANWCGVALAAGVKSHPEIQQVLNLICTPPSPGV